MSKSLAQVARQVRGHRSAMSGGEQSNYAVLAFFEVESLLPQGIARHPGKDRSRAKNEAVVANLGGIGNRPRSRALFESLFERVAAKHPPLP